MKLKIILLSAILLCLVAAGIWYDYATSIRISPQDDDDAIEEKLQKIFAGDNPKVNLRVTCSTIQGNKMVHLSFPKTTGLFEARGFEKLKGIKCGVFIQGKLKALPDLSGTQIDSLVLWTKQDFVINPDRLLAMPNLKYFGAVLSSAQSFVPTKTNINIISLSIDFTQNASFDPGVLDKFPNLKTLMVGSFTAPVNFTAAATRLPATLEDISFWGQCDNYQNMIKAAPGMRMLVLEHGKFDLAGLPDVAPNLTTLYIKDCQIANVHVLQQMPRLATVIFRDFSPQQVENMTRGLPSNIKVIQVGATDNVSDGGKK